MSQAEPGTCGQKKEDKGAAEPRPRPPVSNTQRKLADLALRKLYSNPPRQPEADPKD